MLLHVKWSVEITMTNPNQDILVARKLKLHYNSARTRKNALLMDRKSLQNARNLEQV